MKKIEGHNYDGIEELDNAPPQWFMGLFYGCIAFAVGYFIHYSIGIGPGQLEEYAREVDADDLARYTRMASGGNKMPTEDELQALIADAGVKDKGQKSFQSKCVSCHGVMGQGGIGPNLTDDYWIHGGQLTEIMATISKGVADKGMPPWGPLLPSEEVQALTIYVRHLRGTNPPGAKAPQGNLVTVK